MRIIITTFLLYLPMTASNAQESYNTNNNNDAILSSLLLLMTYVLPAYESDLVEKTEIKGSCSLSPGGCSGATIILLSKKNTIISKQTISSDSNFYFYNLKDKKYIMVIDYPRYKSYIETEVETGKYVNLKLSKK